MSYVTQAEVVDIINHREDIREYILLLEKERKYTPGSFVQLSLDLVTASDIWPESRTFSIASYEKDLMRFIIKNVGVYTSRIFSEMNIGSKCTIKYPYGELFNKGLINEKHLFIAGGVGITPFLGIVKYFETMKKLDNIFLFYCIRYFKDILHYHELSKNLDNRLKLFITREKVDKFNYGHIEIKDIMQVANKETNIYVCGSRTFNSDYKKLLLENGYTKIHIDEWE